MEREKQRRSILSLVKGQPCKEDQDERRHRGYYCRHEAAKLDEGEDIRQVMTMISPERQATISLVRGP